MSKKKNEKKKTEENNNKNTVVEKPAICPVCSSVDIEFRYNRYACNNCGATFNEPKKAELKSKYKPRYID